MIKRSAKVALFGAASLIGLAAIIWFEGEMVEDTLSTFGPQRWLRECDGLNAGDAPLVPAVAGYNDMQVPAFVYRRHNAKGMTLRFEGSASAELLEDGSWDLGGTRFDFTDLTTGELARGYRGVTREKISNGVILGTPEFEALCDEVRKRKAG